MNKYFKVWFQSTDGTNGIIYIAATIGDPIPEKCTCIEDECICFDHFAQYDDYDCQDIIANLVFRKNIPFVAIVDMVEEIPFSEFENPILDGKQFDYTTGSGIIPDQFLGLF